MMKFWRSLRLPPRRLVLWHTVAAVPMGTVVVLGAYLSYHYHQLAIQNRDRVDRAYEVLDVVDGLFISVQNADVAQRDFIITGDASHLSVFQAALRSENEDSERLRQLFRDSPAQEADLSHLDAAVAARITELGQTISVRQSSGFDAARAVIAQAHGAQVMADIRAQVERLSTSERALLNRRQAAGREHERDTLLVGIFIAALSVATRILIALGLRRYRRKQHEALTRAQAEAQATSEVDAVDTV